MNSNGSLTKSRVICKMWMRRLDEQIKTFKQTFDTEKKTLETKDANIVKQMERLETVKAGGGIGGGGLLEGAPLAPVAALSVAADRFCGTKGEHSQGKERKGETGGCSQGQESPTTYICTRFCTLIHHLLVLFLNVLSLTESSSHSYSL